VYYQRVDDLRGRWWNGKWGRLARRDIWLRETAAGWTVTAREGIDEHERRKTWPPTDEAAARALCADLTDVVTDDPLSAEWRELPMDLYRR
jgi:hypothetical protein